MSYKNNIIIFLVNVSFILSQAYFNRVIGDDIFISDARSMGIGNTYLTTGNTSNIILSNPAGLSKVNSNLSVDINFNFRAINERRSIIVKDFFDDIIAEADYVFNQTNYYDHSFGFTYRYNIFNNMNLALAYSQMPIISFNYEYFEEVRGDANHPDGFIGTDDEFLGYQIFTTKGDLYTQSFGLSFSFLDRGKYGGIAIGIGLNRIKPSSIQENFHIDISNEINDMSNFSDVMETRKSFNINADKSFFSTYSLELPISNILNIILSFEEDINVKSDQYSYINLSPNIGLPIYTDYQGFCVNLYEDQSNIDPSILEGISEIDCDAFEENDTDYTVWNDSLEYKLDGLFYNKPEKKNIGFIFQPKNHNKNLLFTFEAASKKTKHYISQWNCDYVDEYNINLDCNENSGENAFKENIIQKDDLYEFKIGFEHYVRNRFPIRAGFQYIERPFNFEPNTIFTLGTGKMINNVILDFALNYSMNEYKYYDLFPQEDIFDSACESTEICSNVKESELSLLTTIKVDF